jgi:hypothetical protein
MIMIPTTTGTSLKSGALLAMSALLVLSLMAGEAHARPCWGCKVESCGALRCVDTGMFRNAADPLRLCQGLIKKD